MARVTGGRKLKAFLRRARSAQARSKSVAVGFFSTAKYPDGTPVAAVAAWNEFGTEWDGRQHVPERPFFRNAIANADEDIMPVLIDGGIDPKDMALDRITAGKVGLAMQARIQRSITTLQEPENAEITVKGGWMRSKTGKLIYIKGKKSTNPLIATGFMRQSTTFVVEDD